MGRPLGVAGKNPLVSSQGPFLMAKYILVSDRILPKVLPYTGVVKPSNTPVLEVFHFETQI